MNTPTTTTTTAYDISLGFQHQIDQINKILFECDTDEERDKLKEPRYIICVRAYQAILNFEDANGKDSNTAWEKMKWVLVSRGFG